MAIITENYVSFETAKLLVKKSFDYSAEYESYYTLGGTIVYFKDNPQDINIAPRITLQMAMKWLREVHNWNIFINKSNTIYGYDANIESLVANHIVEVGCEKTYEDACEAAIKYCLENLI